MTSILVWDLPIRLFHLLLAGGFTAAAVIALALGDESAWFPYHAIIGLVLTALIAFRAAWGLVGTRYARFRAFAFRPADLGGYLKSVATGSGMRHLGHNPGSAYAIFVMLALVAGLATTGILLGRHHEGAEEFHEIFAYALLVVAIIHVLGVLLHAIQCRENLVGSMIHGRKLGAPDQGIGSAHPAIAVVLVAVIGFWTYGLLRNYAPARGTTQLPFFGTTLQLGDEARESTSPREAGQRHDDD